MSLLTPWANKVTKIYKLHVHIQADFANNTYLHNLACAIIEMKTRVTDSLINFVLDFPKGLLDIGGFSRNSVKSQNFLEKSVQKKYKLVYHHFVERIFEVSRYHFLVSVSTSHDSCHKRRVTGNCSFKVHLARFPDRKNLILNPCRKSDHLYFAHHVAFSGKHFSWTAWFSKFSASSEFHFHEDVWYTF